MKLCGHSSIKNSFFPSAGAEWWAQDFRKSMPLLGWVPLIPGTYAAAFMFSFIFIFIYSYDHQISLILALSISPISDFYSC